MIQKHKIEFTRYILVGGAATLVDWTLFFTLHSYSKIPYLAALSLSMVGGTLTHFFLNQKFTFDVHIPHKKKQLIVYLSVVSFSFGSTLLIMSLLVSGLKLPAFPCRVGTTGAMVVLNYILHKFTTFNPDLYDSLTIP